MEQEEIIKLREIYDSLTTLEEKSRFCEIVMRLVLLQSELKPDNTA